MVDYKIMNKEELIELLEIKDKVIEAHAQSITVLAEKYRDEKVNAEVYKSQVEELVKSRDRFYERMCKAETERTKAVQEARTFYLQNLDLQVQVHNLDHALNSEPQPELVQQKKYNSFWLWLRKY